MRATQRMTGAAKRTVESVLREAGGNCAKLMDEKMVDLPCEQIQCDEIWSFVGCKARTLIDRARRKTAKDVAPNQSARREEADVTPAPTEQTGGLFGVAVNTPTAQAVVPPETDPAAARRERAAKFGWGDSWCLIAIDPVSKLIPTWGVGDRGAVTAYHFMRDLQPRLAHRVQLTTDGHLPYLVAVKAAFISTSIDYGMLVKIYGDNSLAGKYSPGNVIGAKKERILGQPETASICTSHVERQNLTVRMGNRRFTRLTNGFSKCLTSHKHSLALHFAHYNFCRIHSALRVTPAMEAKLTDHVWELEELLTWQPKAEVAA